MEGKDDLNEEEKLRDTCVSEDMKCMSVLECE